MRLKVQWCECHPSNAGDLAYLHLFDVDSRELMLMLGKTFFDFLGIVWVWRLAVNVVWILKPWNCLEVKCLFLHGFVMVWGWSSFVLSNFVLFVFNMADLLSRKIYRWNALRTNIQKTLEEARGCINDARVTQAKYLGLQNNINRLCKSLNEIESNVSESMSIMEPVREILAEMSLRIENMRFKDCEQSFETDDNKILNTKPPKLEFPVVKGNRLEWLFFYDQFNISIHQNKTLSDIDRFSYLRRYLAGKALATISGLILYSENYKKALNILIDRYGNPQVLISAHMETLIKIIE